MFLISQTHFFLKTNLKYNSVLGIFFWLKNIVLYHVINYIFYLPSIEKFDTLRIQKYKKCFPPTGPWNSNFDNSGPWKRNFDTWGPRKSNWDRGRRKVNWTGGRGRRRGLWVEKKWYPQITRSNIEHCNHREKVRTIILSYLYEEHF